MKNRLTLGTALRWCAVAALLLAPTFLQYECTSAPTWACRRGDAGPFANTCHGEPTLHQRLGLDHYWTPEYPRGSSMPIVPIRHLGAALPSGNGYVRIRASKQCWDDTPPGFSWCAGNGLGSWEVAVANGDYTPPAEERAFAVRINTFLRDENQRSLVQRQPGAFEAWMLVFYLGAAGVAALALRRSLKLRMDAWLRAGEAIRMQRSSVYR